MFYGVKAARNQNIRDRAKVSPPRYQSSVTTTSGPTHQVQRSLLALWSLKARLAFHFCGDRPTTVMYCAPRLSAHPGLWPNSLLLVLCAQVSAPPGFSEHHTGYALDIGDASEPRTHLEFGEQIMAAGMVCTNTLAHMYR